MKFVIKKTIEAKDIREALKKERQADVVEIYEKETPKSEAGY